MAIFRPLLFLILSWFFSKLFVIFVLQISLTDVFLGGAFSNFGLAAATWSDIEAEDRMDPMIEVFPRYAFILRSQSRTQTKEL